ncbi:MAG: hypothetical protein JWL94_1320 [Microbacteriaceae bacterium]|jgi:thiosulfate/3-mercaptopyruvate sulfurtransferase|uniref:sulfurtransferase n=1 Tax=Naasia sp. TaxID=2546198 RepID=UPI00261D66BF|nr:rhodanese-like domain-containing protein [Naasia sp.]MCU1569694.1 hypothetical protein [Naasia sp.]MCU1638673.1 hypothetical protein [Microbacteriaceae bacterium]
MASPFVSVTALRRELSGATPPAVLDASLVLHPPREDGDYRRESGYPKWLAGHIPASRHVDMARDFSDPTAPLSFTHPEAQVVADRLAALGIAADRRVVVYDGTGMMFASRLWYLLRWIGMDVRVLDGGFAGWKRSGAAVASGEEAPPVPVPTWTPSSPREAWVTKEDLLARTQRDWRPLVCTLPASGYSGADPTRHTRRGHIPGSVNVSSRDLFAPDGTVRGAREIKAAYVGQGITGHEEVLLYCGAGISAAAGALTLAELGVSEVRIYDGSLEEWSAVPALPLEYGA